MVLMPFFSTQKMFCQICGKEFDTDFVTMDRGRWCSRRCYYEWEWRHALSILGKEYYPDPQEYDNDGRPLKKP